MQITGVKNIKYGTVKTLQTGYDKVECAPNLDLTLTAATVVAVFDLCSGLVRTAANTNQKVFLENCPGLRIENVNKLAKTYRNGIPIGGYWITDSADDPSALFGGYWSKSLSAGRSLVSAGTGFALGTEGGEVSHTLTKNEIPAHNHPVLTTNGVAGSEAFNSPEQYTPPTKQGVSYGMRTGNNGLPIPFDASNGYTTDQPHNNMSPYHATNIWERIVDPTTGVLE